MLLAIVDACIITHLQKIKQTLLWLSVSWDAMQEVCMIILSHCNDIISSQAVVLVDTLSTTCRNLCVIRHLKYTPFDDVVYTDIVFYRSMIQSERPPRKYKSVANGNWNNWNVFILFLSMQWKKCLDFSKWNGIMTVDKGIENWTHESLTLVCLKINK